jgi:3-isopropylmalate/(R)-2-methylmalate dehydratase small subunit
MLGGDLMRAFTTLTGIAAPLIRPNIDTDAIIPSREMKGVSKSGLADGLFAGWRYLNERERIPDPNFVLNQPAYAGASILLGGENFGCGSSREHAVWALAEYGFRAVLAPSFAPIFENNCFRNGVLAARLSAEFIDYVATSAGPVSIDLPAQEVKAHDGTAARFDINLEAKEMLVRGLDAIALTLTMSDAIAAFRDRDRSLRPWAYL